MVEKGPISGEALELDNHAREAFNNILILGIAARDCDTSTLKTRWDHKLLRGEPLQAQSIEIIRDAGQAGVDRINGNFLTETVAHSVYDQLFDRFSDESHEDFVEYLSWISQNKWKLFNFPTFEFSSKERFRFIENENRMVRVSNKMFRDQFRPLALARQIPDKFQNLLDDMVETDVGAAFLNDDYLRQRLKFAEAVRGDSEQPTPEERYLRWCIRQGAHFKIKKMGQLASVQALA